MIRYLEISLHRSIFVRFSRFDRRNFSITQWPITEAHSRLRHCSNKVNICGIRWSINAGKFSTAASKHDSTFASYYNETWVTLEKKHTLDDGLNSVEWKLIYFGKDTDKMVWVVWPCSLVFSVTTVGCAIFSLMLFYVYTAGARIRSDILIELLAGFALSAIGLYASCHCRRIMPLRIYQRKQKNANGKREYCIIWYNFLKQRRQFFYDHSETSGARERQSRYPSTNFYARNRPWFVLSKHFRYANDYFTIRLPHDVEEAS